MLTSINDVQEQVQKFWGPIVEKKLKTDYLLSSLVSKEYVGLIKEKGDTVYVTQLTPPTGETRTIGTDADVFQTEKLEKSRIAITITKRFVSSYEFEDLVEILSQIDKDDSIIRKMMEEALQAQIDNFVKTFISPSVTAPVHVITGVSDFNAGEIANLRMKAGQAKWPKSDPWYCLLDCSYYKDLMSATTMISQDYVPNEAPVIAGQIAQKRYGFAVLEDNSKVVDTALAFHPSFCHLALGAPRFKISDEHANRRFGYIMSLDLLGGAAAGFQSELLHMSVAS